MNKYTLYAVLGILIAGLGIYSWINFTTEEDSPVVPVPGTQAALNQNDAKNLSYKIEDMDIALHDGFSEVPVVPDSATKIITRYFGNEVKADINADGVQDTVFLLTQETGGSGTFFYVAAAVSVGDKFMGTDAFLIGDRIAPQTTQFENGIILVNYAGRKKDEPMTTAPSVGRTLRLKFDVEKHVFIPAGEIAVGPSLTSKAWEWVSTEMNNDTVVKPNKPGVFKITFTEKGDVSVKTDCNGMFGRYTLQNNQLTFGNMASTKMYCEGSQETAFAKSFGEVSSFFISPKGELILELKLDSGVVRFK